MKPTEEELLNLKTVLVQGNKIVTGVEWAEYICGRGGSNCSPLTSECQSVKTLEQLSGTKIEKKQLSGMGNSALSYAILAVVDDVIYLAEYCNGCKIHEITCGTHYHYSTEIAYDTELCLTVSPVTAK